MKKNLYIFIIIFAIVVLGGVLYFFSQKEEKNNIPSSGSSPVTFPAEDLPKTMRISSPAFQHNSSIPSNYTCDGENISPELGIEDPPAGTITFVLIMEDPDVPRTIRPDGMWDHWIVWNVPADTRSIPEGTQPQGMRGKNTSGKLSYAGPCPPDREHRYFFKLFALDASLDLPEGSTKQELLAAMEGHIVAQAELIGLYQR